MYDDDDKNNYNLTFTLSLFTLKLASRGEAEMSFRVNTFRHEENGRPWPCSQESCFNNYDASRDQI